MLPAQRAELQKGRVSMRTGNLPLTKTIRSSHANHEASSIDIVQQQRKFGKVNLRQLLIGDMVWNHGTAPSQRCDRGAFYLVCKVGGMTRKLLVHDQIPRPWNP